MAVPVLMPKQGITVESCVITQWNKQVGDAVAKGDLLFTYETDKASFEVVAEDEGILLAVFWPDGEDIPVLSNVAAIGSAGEDASSFAPEGAAAPADTSPAPAVEAAPVPTQLAAPVALQDGAKRAVSPRARATAALLGVDAMLAAGTGPYGRVIERDVRALFEKGEAAQAAAPIVPVASVAVPAASAPVAAAPAQAGGFRETKLSGVRRAIARSMTASLQTMAQLTLSSSFDASAILAARKTFKGSANAQIAGITLTDMVNYATVRALASPEHAHFNAHLSGDMMQFFDDVHLAFAVDTPRGLLVPVIQNAQSMTLRQMSSAVKELAAQAQQGSISPDLLAGGTFTVSNLGGLGIEHFTPVINPPQTGILGINNITYRPKDASGTIYPAMGLSITFDHRALDGADAARFLRAVGRSLENFAELMAG